MRTDESDVFSRSLSLKIRDAYQATLGERLNGCIGLYLVKLESRNRNIRGMNGPENVR